MLSISELVKQKHSLGIKWREVKKKSHQYREEYLQHLIRFYKPHLPNVSKIVQTILSMERKRAQFRRIKITFNTAGDQPMNHLIVDDERITDPHDMAKLLLSHYRLTINDNSLSLPVNPQFITSFGFYGEGIDSVQLLRGEYNNEAYTLSEKQILDVCQFTEKIPQLPIDTIISIEEFRSLF